MLIAYTNRVVVEVKYGERRDCCDQSIPSMLSECGFLPVSLPNIPKLAIKYMDSLKPDGVFFTGGNSLVKQGGDAEERDIFEKTLLEIAIARDIPVLGICRGMQMILDYFGCNIHKVENHVNVMHAVDGAIDREVNSYHLYGFREVVSPFEVLAKSSDGVVEAVRHPNHRVTAIMWHPERVKPFDQRDLEFVKRCFE